MLSLFESLGASLKTFFHTNTPEENYESGRKYARKTLTDSGEQPPQELIDTLWAQSKIDRSFGGDGEFDRGIESVLMEHGYKDPESPCW